MYLIIGVCNTKTRPENWSGHLLSGGSSQTNQVTTEQHLTQKLWGKIGSGLTAQACSIVTAIGQKLY